MKDFDLAFYRRGGAQESDMTLARFLHTIMSIILSIILKLFIPPHTLEKSRKDRVSRRRAYHTFETDKSYSPSSIRTKAKANKC